MFDVEEMLKATEAAVVSGVSVREVNRVIDEHILPASFVSKEAGRYVSGAGCVLISFYFSSAEQLTASERLHIIKEVEPRLREGGNAWNPFFWSHAVEHDFLSVNLARFFERAGDRMERLSAARDLVVSDPEVLGGTPVIRGTRIPVYDVAASVAAGIPADRIIEAYPALDADRVGLAALYAEAYPPRGRPRSSDTLPAGAVIVADRRVRRRGTTG